MNFGFQTVVDGQIEDAADERVYFSRVKVDVDGKIIGDPEFVVCTDFVFAF